MLKGIGIRPGIPEGHVPEFDLIIIIATLTEGPLFHRKRTLWKNIFHIQVFQGGGLPVRGYGILVQNQKDMCNGLGKPVDNTRIFHHGAHAKGPGHRPGHHENIGEHLQETGGKITDKSRFHIVDDKLSGPFFLDPDISLQFTLYQRLCAVNTDILPIVIVLILPKEVAQIALIQTVVIQKPEQLLIASCLKPHLKHDHDAKQDKKRKDRHIRKNTAVQKQGNQRSKRNQRRNRTSQKQRKLPYQGIKTGSPVVVMLNPGADIVNRRAVQERIIHGDRLHAHQGVKGFPTHVGVNLS